MRCTLFGLLMVIAPISLPALGAVVGPNAFSPSATRLDFEDLAAAPTLSGGEQLNNQYLAQGVVFVNPSYGSYASTAVATATSLNSDPNMIWVEQGSGAAGSMVAPLEIRFSTPAVKLGANLRTSRDATFTMKLYNSQSELLDSFTTTLPTLAGDGREGFVGLAVNEQIAKATFQSNAFGGPSFNFFFDDLVFEVPEPASLGGMAGGLAAIAFVAQARRRISSHSTRSDARAALRGD